MRQTIKGISNSTTHWLDYEARGSSSKRFNVSLSLLKFAFDPCIMNNVLLQVQIKDLKNPTKGLELNLKSKFCPNACNCKHKLLDNWINGVQQKGYHSINHEEIKNSKTSQKVSQWNKFSIQNEIKLNFFRNLSGDILEVQEIRKHLGHSPCRRNLRSIRTRT